MRLTPISASEGGCLEADHRPSSTRARVLAAPRWLTWLAPTHTEAHHRGQPMSVHSAARVPTGIDDRHTHVATQRVVIRMILT